jgi:hypothetical protein
MPEETTKLWLGKSLGLLLIILAMVLFFWNSSWGAVCRTLMILLGLFILILFIWKPRTLPYKSSVWKTYTSVLDIFLWMWIGAFVLAGLFFVVLFVLTRFSTNVLARFPEGIQLFEKPWLFWLTWVPILLLSYILRRFLVEYVGDVAAYISPHKLDRFAKIRTDIQGEALAALSHIYQQDYQSIILVGHSLGSVVAYDTLNTLLAEAELDKSKKDYVQRTKLLLTFGSPLDKTAFIFATRGDGYSEARGRLAEARQPLIKDFTYRQIPWVNLYGHRDIISGDLNFYDLPKDQTRQPKHSRIKNKTDKDALIPVAAHGEYWENKELFRILVRKIFSGR